MRTSWASPRHVHWEASEDDNQKGTLTAERYLLESSVAAAAVQKRLLRQRLVCCVAQAQADVLLSRLHLCLPGWRAAAGRRRRAEQQFDWQEAARARGLAWDGRGTDSADFDEPQGAHRHH